MSTTSPAHGSPPDELVVSIDDGVATLRLNRPHKRNAVTHQMWLGLAEHCRRLATDPEVRVLVVRGEGEHFCAGADIAGLADLDPDEYAEANAAADEALAAFPKPTIAAIRGACVGGGAEIAVACDLRIADDTARFGITPARLGLVYPAGAVERVVRLIGPGAAKHLLFSAELIEAERALRIGLVGEVHGAGQLDARIDELTSRLAHERSLLTQMASKEMVDAAAGGGRIDPATAARWHAEVARSGESAEGIAAFRERRPPRFAWTPST